MDFGDGVQNLLVSDVLHRDCLRVGVDQAGYVSAEHFSAFLLPCCC